MHCKSYLPRPPPLLWARTFKYTSGTALWLVNKPQPTDHFFQFIISPAPICPYGTQSNSEMSSKLIVKIHYSTLGGWVWVSIPEQCWHRHHQFTPLKAPHPRRLAGLSTSSSSMSFRSASLFLTRHVLLFFTVDFQNLLENCLLPWSQSAGERWHTCVDILRWEVPPLSIFLYYPANTVINRRWLLIGEAFL